jgi:hypothetical protein
MILPELYLDNSVVLGTNDPLDPTSAMRARAFATGVEGLFTGKTLTGYLALSDDVDASPLTGLSWSFTEEGSTARYWAELLGADITTHAASFVAGQTPLYPHFVSGADYHEVGSAVVVKAVRPLTGFPTAIRWENDFFFRLKLTRQRVTDGQLEDWAGAALEVFLSTTNTIAATEAHASLALAVGTGLTEIANGEFVGGFEGSNITAHLSAGSPIYAIAKVGQQFRAAAQLTVTKERPAT